MLSGAPGATLLNRKSKSETSMCTNIIYKYHGLSATYLHYQLSHVDTRGHNRNQNFTCRHFHCLITYFYLPFGLKYASIKLKTPFPRCPHKSPRGAWCQRQLTAPCTLDPKNERATKLVRGAPHINTVVASVAPAALRVNLDTADLDGWP